MILDTVEYIEGSAIDIKDTKALEKLLKKIKNATLKAGFSNYDFLGYIQYKAGRI